MSYNEDEQFLATVASSEGLRNNLVNELENLGTTTVMSNVDLPWGYAMTGLAYLASNKDLLIGDKEEHKSAVWDQICELLPRLAHPAQMLIVVDYPGTRPTTKLWRLVDWMLREIHIDTQNHLGIDVSINSLLLPPTVDEKIVAKRIVNYLSQSEWATTGAIVDYHDIIAQSIGRAIGGTTA
nr:hypothetical protein [Rhodococcus sp. (in: high G+C Gram-positive bacteria)]